MKNKARDTLEDKLIFNVMVSPLKLTLAQLVSSSGIIYLPPMFLE